MKKYWIFSFSLSCGWSKEPKPKAKTVWHWHDQLIPVHAFYRLSLMHHLRLQDARCQRPPTSHSRRWLTNARFFRWRNSKRCPCSWASNTKTNQMSCRSIKLTTREQSIFPLTTRCLSSEQFAWYYHLFLFAHFTNAYQSGIGRNETKTTSIMEWDA